MLTSNQSNTVFYSAHSFNDFKPEVENINNCLSKHGVDFVPLTGTEDYFCRDYMPIQKDEHTLVQFTFKPDYLINNPRLKDFVTDPETVLKKNSFLNKFEIIHSNIILDGGNLVHSEKTAIISEKVLIDNPGYTTKKLIGEIGKLLGVKVIIVPALDDDATGHVDGMLQFIDENTVLTVYLDDEDAKWKNKLLNVLKNKGIKVISLPLLPYERDDQWAYVNFLHVGNLIILPALNEQNDKIIQDFFKNLFPDKEICFLEFNRILQQGGAVNCFTWDIVGGFSNDELKITEHKYLSRYPINPKHTKLILGSIHPHNVADFYLQFFYGNKCTLWQILHDAFPGFMPDAISEMDLVTFLDSAKTSISDVVIKCKRLSDSASDEHFIPLELNHGLLKQIKKSNIDEIFFTSGFEKNNAFKLFYEDILKLKITAKIKEERQVILPKKYFGRPVKLTILYSPSGSANRALKKTALYKLNEDKYKQFPKPVEQFKIDYYKEKFGYMGKKMAQSQESINEEIDSAEIILTALAFARKDQFLC
jgi:agmatine/peptidylarginine deiminase